MKILAAAVVSFAVCAALWSDPHPRLADFEELRDYSSWQEVTSGPHKVLPEISALCAPPIPPEPHPGAAEAQGKDRYIRVFASSHTASLMREPRVESYPEGSVVAKVKLIEGSSEPTGVAFMIKREAGYNPEGRDWEYLLFEGKPLELSARGAISTCQACHGEQTYTDGLYRSYLSDGTPPRNTRETPRLSRWEPRKPGRERSPSSNSRLPSGYSRLNASSEPRQALFAPLPFFRSPSIVSFTPHLRRPAPPQSNFSRLSIPLEPRKESLEPRFAGRARCVEKGGPRIARLSRRHNLLSRL